MTRESHVPSSIFFEDLVVDAAGNVFCTTEENQVFAYSATGQQLWTMQLTPNYFGTLPPVIGPEGSLYVQNGNYLVAIIPEPGAAGLFALALGLLRRRPRRR